MKPPDKPKAVLLIDGKAPSLVREAARLGLTCAPMCEGVPAGRGPVLYVSAADADSVLAGMMPPFSGFVEASATDLGQGCLNAVAEGGVCLSLTTASAYTIDPAPILGRMVRRRFGAPNEMAELIELSLAEAMANAVIHGNLGIDSGLRATFDGFSRFSALVEERLRSPMRATRRVEVTIVRGAGGGLVVAVSDQGAGFNVNGELAKPLEAGAKSGRGLALIRKMAESVHGDDGGRTLVMKFRPCGYAQTGLLGRECKA